MTQRQTDRHREREREKRKEQATQTPKLKTASHLRILVTVPKDQFLPLNVEQKIAAVLTKTVHKWRAKVGTNL